MSVYTERVTILRAPLADSVYGQVRDWSKVRPAGAFRASVQPSPGNQSAPDESADRETALTRLRVYLQGSADVSAEDRVRWRGTDYEVVGQPYVWHSRGRARYTALTVQVVNA
ncbi:hypothetical protein GCM10010466_29300 [Planomonospora alba]|uniref:Head-to-tail stopper n=1 Tax=Planomonospora alba TaxID=161354 RepID=A0ABP6N4Y1_9ACTN